MYFRLKHSGIEFDRPKNNTKYRNLYHKAQKRNMKRFQILKEIKYKYHEDGLNSLKYNLRKTAKFLLFTHIIVDVGQLNNKN